jgi:hypothetical protein
VYDADALQVFNRRARGGVYWYRAGWNVRATVSWAVGAGCGLLAVSLPSYEGPLLSLTGGVDCSFVLSGLVGGVTYVLPELRVLSRPGSATPARPAFEDEAVQAESGGLGAAAPSERRPTPAHPSESAAHNPRKTFPHRRA